MKCNSCYKLFLFVVFGMFAVLSCGGSDQAKAATEGEEKGKQPKIQTQTRVYCDEELVKNSLFIVISKAELSLSVYAAEGADTILVARYPVCLSKARGQKQKRGDMKTPESEPGKPFKITQIQDASTWCHDFHDGKGNHLAYGHWFLRLLTPGHSGIGIHGSTGNEWSIPSSKEEVPKGRERGRDSEGCIRLSDQDIIHLKENYAYVGMPVIIKNEGQGDKPFETKALSKAGEGHAPKYKTAEKKADPRLGFSKNNN